MLLSIEEARKAYHAMADLKLKLIQNPVPIVIEDFEMGTVWAETFGNERTAFQAGIKWMIYHESTGYQPESRLGFIGIFGEKYNDTGPARFVFDINMSSEPIGRTIEEIILPLFREMKIFAEEVSIQTNITPGMFVCEKGDYTKMSCPCLLINYHNKLRNLR